MSPMIGKKIVRMIQPARFRSLRSTMRHTSHRQTTQMMNQTVP